jgi:hypothetical protein
VEAPVLRSHVAKGPYMNQARSGSRVNWRRVWPLIDLATGITGLALLIVGDLGGNRPLRALGVVLIGIAAMAVVAHLCSRRGGKAPPTGTQ